MMNVIANVFHPAAQVSPEIEDSVRVLMAREFKGSVKTRRLGRAVPVTIRGVTYSSMREASLAIGVHVKTVENAKMRGQFALDRVGLRIGKSREVGTHGRVFKSVKECAEAFGVSESQISRRIKNGTLHELVLPEGLA